MTDKELMQQALDALEYASDMTKPENMSGCECPICVTITALRDRLAQTEPVTGNLLKDAYNAMVEKKTRSQKLREAGFTRRPKGWEKEKDEQEPVAWYHADNYKTHFTTEPSPDLIGKYWKPLYITQPQRKSLTNEQLKPLIQKAMMYYGHNPDHWLRTSGAGFCILARAIEAAHGIKS